MNQAEVAQRAGQAGGEEHFVGLAGVHAGRAVEHDVQREVFFLLKEFDEEAVEAGQDVPVDVAEVVTGDVGAVVVELDAAAAAFAAALALELAGEELAGEDVDGIELCGELRGQELGDGCGRFDGGGDHA